MVLVVVLLMVGSIFSGIGENINKDLLGEWEVVNSKNKIFIGVRFLLIIEDGKTDFFWYATYKTENRTAIFVLPYDKQNGIAKQYYVIDGGLILCDIDIDTGKIGKPTYFTKVDK